MPTVFVPAPDAVETVQKLGQPGLRPAAEAIAESLPSFVPVVRGVMQRTYKPTIDDAETSMHVLVGSPFWHWMEYGTRFNPAYRPVQNCVSALGLRYEAH
jgi:hypothetical protein